MKPSKYSNNIVKKARNNIRDFVSKGTKSLKRARSEVGEATKQLSSFGTDVIKGRKEIGKNTVKFVRSSAKTGKIKFKDDIELLRSECALLNCWKETKIPTPVMQSAIYAAAGLGVFANEVELARFTRAIITNYLLNPDFDAVAIGFGQIVCPR